MYPHNVFLFTASFPPPFLIYSTRLYWVAFPRVSQPKGRETRVSVFQTANAFPFHLCIGKHPTRRLAAINPFTGRWCSCPGSDLSLQARVPLILVAGARSCCSHPAPLLRWVGMALWNGFFSSELLMLLNS